MAAVAYDSEKQLAWEARHRTRAGIAAIAGAIGLFLYFALEQVVLRGIPDSSGLDALVRATQPGKVADLQSLRIPYFEYLQDKDPVLLARAFGGMLGFFGLAWATGFLAVATRARMPVFRRFLIYFPIVGGAVVGIGVVLSQIGTSALVREFLDGPRRVQDATLEPSGLSLFSGVLTPLGSLLLAVGLVFTSLHAMRAGLLTKLFGYVGIVGGAMLIVFPLPIVHTFWLAGLGVLFLGRWPGGDLPAWRTGNAEPWPTPARPEPRSRQRPRPATDPPAPSPRRKRKKRN